MDDVVDLCLSGRNGRLMASQGTDKFSLARRLDHFRRLADSPDGLLSGA